jgi:hypothetical protein
MSKGDSAKKGAPRTEHEALRVWTCFLGLLEEFYAQPTKVATQLKNSREQQRFVEAWHLPSSHDETEALANRKRDELLLVSTGAAVTEPN